MKRRLVLAVTFLIVVCGLAGAESAFAAGNEYEKRDDPFAFRGGAVLQELREEAREYPDAFDLRHVDLDGDGTADKSFVTPVRLQNPFGTCWGFSAASAAESALIADGLADETVDLSEKHIAWFTTSYIDDPKNSQNGEGWYFEDLTSKDLDTSAYRYKTGGSSFYATSLFGAGMGPVVESAKDPETGESLGDYLEYRGVRGEKTIRRTAIAYDEDGNPTKWARKAVWSSDEDDWSIPEKYRFLQNYRLKDSVLLPALSDIPGEILEDSLNAWKQQLYKGHRAISVGFCTETYLPGQDTASSRYMSDKWAHYVYEAEFPNHAVTIVGWDDNYPKENFRHHVDDPDVSDDETVPPGDGAFLIKNSWGSELNDYPNNGYRHWGLLEGLDGVPYDPDAKATSDRATGYFWISYYDRTICDPEAYMFDESAEGNDLDIAQMDFLQSSYIELYEGDENIRSANIFTADKTSELNEIAVMTAVPGTEVNYSVYMLPDGFDDPEDGILIASGKAGPFDYGGYHRFSVDASRVLPKGQKYSVVTYDTAPADLRDRDCAPDGSYVPYKTYFDMHMDMGFYSKAIVNEGESFCTIKGKWTDISDHDVQTDITRSYNHYMDNFPTKAFLEPTDFQGYLTVNNWQDGNPGRFEIGDVESKTLAAEFRYADAFPDDWDPEITWTSSDESIVKVTPKADDCGEAVIQGVAGGKAYLIVDAGEYGTRVIGITVKKPQIEYFIYDDSEITYTGKPITPKVTHVYTDLRDEEAELVEGVDYTVEYKDNVEAGEGKIIVTGIGRYGGVEEETFDIYKAANTMKASGKTLKLKASALKKKTKTIKASRAYSVKSAVGDVTYEKVSGVKKLNVASNGNITVMKGTGKGTYKLKVKISAKGDKNHKAASKTVKVTIKVI